LRLLSRTHLSLCALFALAAAGAGTLERGMLGGSPSRNMVSGETGLPDTWDPETGLNIRWVAELGSETYGGPVVAAGKVFVGTNNAHPRNAEVRGDRGVLMAFRASDGRFLWQATHSKLAAGRAQDWPLQGVCSTPFVDGDRLYYVSNRGELVAADSEGFLDGENDGPYQAEERRGATDTDIVWKLDMPGELGVRPHNMSASSPLVVGDLVYTVTSNGVDDRGRVPAPEAPSFLAVDRRSGRVVWSDASPGTRILDGQWSSPSYGLVNGRAQVLFPGGDGWLYAFEPTSGELLWKFDANRPPPAKQSAVTAGGRENLIACAVIHDGRVFIGVGHDPELGAGRGRLWALEVKGRGDVSEGAVVWQRGGEEFRRTLSTVAVNDGLLYAADLNGFLHCLDAETGRPYWTYDAFAAIWGSPLVADGKVYIADEDGDVAVLRAGKKMELIHEANMGDAIYTTPAARDGVLYIATRSRLFAVGEGSAGP
jgi:outer membrane protein assembly factor BamB